MRRSGETYRHVLQALLAASKGDHVVFVSNTRGHADIAFDYLRTLTSCLTDVWYTQNKVVFPGGGSVEIITEHKYKIKEIFRGRRCIFIFDRVIL